MDGTILSVGGATGDHVTGQSRTAFITLGDLTDMQVRAMFPLGEVNELKLGQAATIGLGMLAGHTYRGTVTRIDPAATTSGTRALFGVMISLDDAPIGPAYGHERHRRGDHGGGRRTRCTSRPVRSTRAPVARSTVLVRHAGRTVVRTVHPGVRGDRYVAITSGLTAGDHIVMPAGTGEDGFPTATFPGT